MEIEVSNEAGLKLGANYEDIPIESKIGTNGNMKIKVKYK